MRKKTWYEKPFNSDTYICTYIHIYIPTYIHTYTYLQKYIHTYVHTYIHVLMITSLHAYYHSNDMSLARVMRDKASDLPHIIHSW